MTQENRNSESTRKSIVLYKYDTWYDKWFDRTYGRFKPCVRPRKISSHRHQGVQPDRVLLFDIYAAGEIVIYPVGDWSHLDDEPCTLYDMWRNLGEVEFASCTFVNMRKEAGLLSLTRLTLATL